MARVGGTVLVLIEVFSEIGALQSRIWIAQRVRHQKLRCVGTTTGQFQIFDESSSG